MFVQQVSNWYQLNKRDLPWRKTTDPYLIWLSEVILQQTRVDQGLPYFVKFQDRFKSVSMFAEASEDEVLKLWQGLGYYSRARNMHATAKRIVAEYNGQFPTKYEELIKLNGIGEYTAAAISSFAANEAHAVVDGNVYRLLSRYFGLSIPIDSALGKKTFKDMAYELLKDALPSVYNQAVMEFGSIQCKPISPDCSICPLRMDCVAFKEQLVDALPVKSKKTKVTKRYFDYFVFRNDNNLLLKKRIEKDIWQNMYDFPLIENDKQLSEQELLESEAFKLIMNGRANSTIRKVTVETKHVLSHQVIYARFWEVDQAGYEIDSQGDMVWVANEDMVRFALPKLVDNYLKKF